MTDAVLLVAYVLCLVGSFFFAGSETAITSLTDSAVLRLSEEGRAGAPRLKRLRADLSRTLSSLVVGNTVVNISSGSIAAALLIEPLGEQLGVLVATVATTALFLLFGELTPKTLGARRAEEFALVVSRPVELVVRVLSPVTWVFGRFTAVLLRPLGASENVSHDVTADDVKSLITLSHQQGELKSEEKEILHAFLDFGDKPVRDAMVPSARIVALPADAGFERVEEVCRENHYSRYPVYRGGEDEIVGILHVKDLFDVTDAEERHFDVSRYLRPAVFVPELKRSGDLFREMRRRRFHMAVVVDELGNTSGLVTLEDLMEQIVGDISDEHDEPTRRPISDGTSLILEGNYPLEALRRELGVPLEEPRAETVAGFLLARLGRIPRAGQKHVEGELEFLVERATPRAVERIRITRRSEAGRQPPTLRRAS